MRAMYAASAAACVLMSPMSAWCVAMNASQKVEGGGGEGVGVICGQAWPRARVAPAVNGCRPSVNVLLVPAGPRTGPTKAGDAGLRQQLYLAAKRARLIDPTLAAKYHRLVVEQGKHHVSAICNLAPILLTRVAACWRNGQRYVLRDIDGREITPAEGRQICADRYSIPDEVRRRRRRTTKTKQHKGRTGQRDQESTSAAPASDPSHPETYRRTA